MLALVNTPTGPAPVELREVAEPQPAANEAVLAIRAFALNRGGAIQRHRRRGLDEHDAVEDERGKSEGALQAWL